MDVRASPALVLKAVRISTAILCMNGQTTQRIIEDAALVGSALGYKINVFPSWNQFIITLDHQTDAVTDKHHPQTCLTPIPMIEVLDVMPVGVDMNKVSRTSRTLDQLCTGALSVEQALEQLDQIAKLPPASTLRFSLMAGLGAAALALIFGVVEPLTLFVIFLSAALGAAVRRLIAQCTKNIFAQPFIAALIAGVVGAILHPFNFDSTLQFIEVCPCMILVPGAHIINGSLDFARGRISFGMSRLVFAGLIVLMICLGLLLGLWLGGQTLAPQVVSDTLPLWADMLAASLAIAAFGTFFSMPWRELSIPMVIGAVAHALRWSVIDWSHDAVFGAAAACLFAGIVATPLAHRLKLPFAALAFSSVVSLMPGVFLFRMSSELVEIYKLGGQSTQSILGYAASDAMTTMMICLAIAFGLIIPKLVIDRLFYHVQ